MKRILTIAGSDSGGGAGIQADLKTISLLGGFGMSAITAITAQNTIGVQDIFPVPHEIVEKQIDSILTDIGVDAVKTGMLLNSQVIEVVGKRIKEHRIEKLIVDPVMVAKGGQALLSGDALEILIHELVPLAFIITPNLPEAGMLCGRTIESVKEMREAARQLSQKGAQNVLIKGGHLQGRAIDVLFDGQRFFEYDSERIPTKNTHGTGCVYSAALATEVAKGNQVPEAVKNAKAFVTSAIQNSLNMGKGFGPTNPYAFFSKEIERYQVISCLKEAIQALKEKRIGCLIPEVQSNLGMALSYANTIEDVAAVPGRIVRIGDTITTVSEPEFGASQHIARIILAMMKYDKEMRSAMNVRYSEDIIRRCRKAGLKTKYFDRKREPDTIRRKEGASLTWGLARVLKEEDEIPDVAYDTGDMGKEPMIRILGRNPQEVVEKVMRIANS